MAFWDGQTQLLISEIIGTMSYGGGEHTSLICKRTHRRKFREGPAAQRTEQSRREIESGRTTRGEIYWYTMSA